MAVIPPTNIPPPVTVTPPGITVPSQGILPGNTSGDTAGEAVKGCLGFVVALLIAGSVAEAIYRINPKASYMFVAVVLLGYASTGGNLTKVTDFFNSVTSVNKVTGGGRQR